MKAYLSHKQVKAAKVVDVLPSNYGRSFIFHLDDGSNAAPPQGMCADNPIGGYYVVYQDGYTSWSPAAAFEEGYAEIKPDTSTALDRAKVEFQQLSDRKDALVLFIQGSEFGKLPELTRSQLLNQSRFMEGYAAVLAERIRGWA